MSRVPTGPPPGGQVINVRQSHGDQLVEVCPVGGVQWLVESNPEWSNHRLEPNSLVVTTINATCEHGTKGRSRG